MLRGGDLRHLNAASTHSAHFRCGTDSFATSVAVPRKLPARLTVFARVTDLRFRKAQREDIPVMRRMIFQER